MLKYFCDQWNIFETGMLYYFQHSTLLCLEDNKTKGLKSREEGELKSKRWMMIKVDWWLKSIDDYLKLIDEIVLQTN